jgi:hypothetical protein
MDPLVDAIKQLKPVIGYMVVLELYGNYREMPHVLKAQYRNEAHYRDSVTYPVVATNSLENKQRYRQAAL